jgi:hypothetical protein
MQEKRMKIQQQDDLRQSSCGIRYLFLTPRLSVSAIQRARPDPLSVSCTLRKGLRTAHELDDADVEVAVELLLRQPYPP